MKTIGPAGGMTWLSTVEYYRLINAGVQARLGVFSTRFLCIIRVWEPWSRRGKLT
jgi:aspartate/glutamate racemase